ncbi:dynamin family protein [Selenomonas sputigena]|uniref:Dynamin family protein n=1 Tax=Selenomonas sputigena TaxID=69823 RepID=A0ABV3X7S0_9FIRM
MEKDTVVLQNRLRRLHGYFESSGDAASAHKVRQLAQKLVKGEFGMAFCGHFSAGKSRMINRLLGAMLLPSSPIPTSANLVLLRRGEEYAEARFREGKPRRYLAPYDYDLVKSFCRDGTAIESIEISTRTAALPEGVVLMDTPGIDSTDAAHRLATEEAIHLADLIFYVMDYNHVQSEESFLFAKSLTEAKKRVVLVVNQIDKHREEELSFEAFARGVEDAFAAWGVQPEKIFFTSMKEDAHAHNDFKALQAYLQDAIAGRAAALAESIARSLEKICADAVQQAAKAEEKELAPALAVLERLSAAEREALWAGSRALEKEAALLRSDGRPAFQEGFEKILANAYMMPYEVRELARLYLEASAPTFKVGFFGRGRKTAAEKESRRSRLWQALEEKVRLQVDWHVATYLKDFARDNHIAPEAVAAAAEGFTALPAQDVLEACQKEGADTAYDGSYVLNYTASLEKAVKECARLRLAPVADGLFAQIAERSGERLASIGQELQGMKEEVAALSADHAARKRIKAKEKELAALLAAQEEKDCSGDELFRLVVPAVEIVAGDGTPAAAERTAEEAAPAAAPRAASAAAGVETGDAAGAQGADAAGTADAAADAARAELAGWVPRLRRAGELVAPVPGLQRLADELAARAVRLENRGYLVTLFGAFSAGKSSFANALLGENLLPVSPNPTTAVIQKILPVTKERPHGTVRVHIKDEAMLLADLNRALKPFGHEAANLAEAPGLVAEALALESELRQQQAFLRAYDKGRAAFEGRAGTTLSCGLAEFADYAVTEEKACFIEEIEIYSDCALTRKGITLVDTPGADSINARHTDLSFRFIRQSDAILFVTYYNHAFSHADSEFLVQLGRVKDAFEMDKMFFIVNAIDLAESEEDAEAVLAYVRRNLQGFGITKPRLHAVSSLAVLREKLGGSYRGTEFETAFYRFVFHDLAGLALRAAQGDYERTKTMLDTLIEESEESAEQKALRREKLEENAGKARELLESQSPVPIEKRVAQEQAELLYYVEERIFLRYEDMFRRSFNAATIGREHGKASLKKAMEELLAAIGFDIAQEMRATSVRLERFLAKCGKELQQSLGARLAEDERGFSLTAESVDFEMELSFQTAFRDIEAREFQKALALFKNPAHFFEKGGSKEMAEALKEKLRPMVAAHIEKEGARLKERSEEGSREVFRRAVEHVRRQAEGYYEGHRAALAGGLPTAKLREIRAGL